MEQLWAVPIAVGFALFFLIVVGLIAVSVYLLIVIFDQIKRVK